MANLGINFPFQHCNFRQKMGPEKVRSNQHFKRHKTSSLRVQVLVVDDDSTSLAIVSTMLKKCGQQDSIFELSIVTVRSPLDALSTLRLQKEMFDLVVTDLHMPEMNGIELQRHVIEEFKVPVVLMSSDDKESSITESLDHGAAGYLVKPAKPDDVKNVWQYAVSAKKGKSNVISEIVERGSSSSSFHEEINSSSSVNNDGQSGIEDSKKKRKKAAVGEEEDDQAATRKHKVVWTDALHHRFLHALHHFGLDKAVPKKIVEFMNVPGLTRENIASHLQKYRLFLQKVTERRASTSNNNFSRRRSVFAAGEAFMLNLKQQKMMRSSIQSGPGRSGISSAPTSSSFGSPRLPGQAIVLTNSALQGRNGTSHVLGNPARFQQPMFGKTENFPCQEKSTRLEGMKSNTSLVNRPLSRGLVMPHSLTNATSGLPNVVPSTMQMHQQHNRARLSNNKIGAPFQNNLGSGIGNTRTINSSYSFPSNNSYTGMRMTGYGGLTEPGKNPLNGAEAPSGFKNVQGLVNWNPFDNMNLTPMGNGPLGYSAESGPNATGFFSATTDDFPPSFAPANQQNSSLLWPLSQQQHVLGNGGGEIIQNQNTINESYKFDDISNLQQFGEDDFGLGEIFLQPTSHLTPYQQKSGAALSNDNFLNSSYYHEGNTSSMNSLLNPELPSAYNAGEKAPCNEQSSGKLQDGGGEVNIGANDISADDYSPTLNQQQSGVNLLDAELSDMFAADNAISENQLWSEEFLESFFGTEPNVEEMTSPGIQS